MKLLAILFTSIGLTAIGSAQNEPPANLHITVDFLQVDADTATELLHGDATATTPREWHEVLIKLAKNKETKTLASLSVMTKSGQRATAESGREKVYPTEFSPAAGRKENSPPVPSTLTGVDVPTPTAFEMRPVGARLEVDPTLGPDRQTLDLNLAPEMVIDLGEDTVWRLAGDDSAKTAISMPRFYSMKTQTAVTLSDGGSALVGVLLLAD